MAVPFYGDYDTTETVNIPFNTFSSDDPSASVTVTDLAAGDIEIHKDGSATQRASDNGVTVSINFDSVTGNHMVHIDLSDDTDSGFYSAGSRYQVRLEGITVDGATLNVWVGSFSIGCTLRPTTAGRTLDIQATGEVDANMTMIGGVAQSATDLKDFADTGYTPGTHSVALVDACTSNTDMRGTDNAALASVLGALADAAAAGEVTEADTVMQYVKQLINILIGAAGIGTFPAEAAPGDGVSLAEVIRAIHVDVTGLNGDAMRGTDGANTTVPDAAGTAAALHAITDAYIDTEIGSILTAVGTTLVNHLLDIKGTGFAKDTHSLPQCLTATGFSTHAAADVKTAIEAAGSHLALIKAVTDALTAAAGTKLALTASTMVTGTVSHDNTAATTTVFYSDDITEATADHYNGRIVLFTSGVLVGQATDITDYELDTGEGKFTVTALTEAPADNVTFIIV